MVKGLIDFANFYKKSNNSSEYKILNHAIHLSGNCVEENKNSFLKIIENRIEEEGNFFQFTLS